MADVGGTARFDANGQFSVTEGDLVRVSDGLVPQTVKETIVRYLTLTELETDGDALSGAARPGQQVHVFFGAEVHTQVGSAIADGAGWWTCVTSYDLVPGTDGFVQTTDEDGDHTQINWGAPRSEGWQHNPATSHDYLFVGNGMSWTDAEAYAVSLGGHLETANDAAENDWLIATFGAEYCIGMTDRASEGTWVWVSGEPVTFTGWFAGEPNDYLGEDVAVIENRPPIGWNDVSSGDSFVVEVGPATLNELLADLVADGRLPNSGVAASIMNQAQKAPLKALTNHLKDLVRRSVITQQTMDQILAMVAG